MSNTLKIGFNQGLFTLQASTIKYGLTPVRLGFTTSGGGGGGGVGGGRTLSIDATGKAVDQNGNPLVLHGGNCASINNQVFSGHLNPWGSFDGPTDPMIPMLRNARNHNLERFTLNAHSFRSLVTKGMTGTNTGNATWNGGTVNCNPGNNYKDYLLRWALQCRQFSIYPYINLHQCAPKFTLGTDTEYLAAVDESPFMDYDTCVDHWGGTDPATSLPAQITCWFGSAAFNGKTGAFASRPGPVYNGGAAGAYFDATIGGASGTGDFSYELFNEPQFGNLTFPLTSTAATNAGNAAWRAANGGNGYNTTDGATPPLTPGHVASLNNPGTEWVYLNGGYMTGISQQGVFMGGAGIPFGNLLLKWRVYGYQQARDAMRANGFNNVLWVPGDAFASQQSSIGYIVPDDSGTAPNALSIPQIGTHVHLYAANNNFPSTSDPGDGTATANQWIIKTANGTGTLGRAIPVIITESDPFGGSGPGSSAATLTTYLLNTIDAQAVGRMHYAVFAANNTLLQGAGGNNSYIGGGIFTNAVNVTGSMVVGDHFKVPSIMTVTNASPGQLAPGMQCQSGLSKEGFPCILAQLSSTEMGGALGGKGTYSMSDDQTCSSQSLTFRAVTTCAGGDITYANWSNGKPP